MKFQILMSLPAVTLEGWDRRRWMAIGIIHRVTSVVMFALSHRKPSVSTRWPISVVLA